MPGEYEQHSHEFEPVYNEASRVLILGTFPSVKSREQGFYYGHPQNRFWKLLARIFECPIPENIEEKKQMLLRNHVAIWDVIASCEIVGSSDSSIRNVVPTNLCEVISKAPIEKIYANGAMAANLYDKYQKQLTQRDIIKLPSTSPANAVWNMERLYEVWKNIKEVPIKK